MKPLFHPGDALFQTAVTKAGCLIWEGTVCWAMQEDTTRSHWDIQILGGEAFLSWLPIAFDRQAPLFDLLQNACLPEDQQTRLTNLHHALRTHQGFYSQRLRYILADGSLCWLKENIQIETITPNQWRLVGTLADVTSLQQVQDQLNVALDRTKSLVWQSAVDRLPITSTTGLLHARQQGTEHLGFYYHWHSGQVQNASAVEQWLPVPRLPEESYTSALFRAFASDPTVSALQCSIDALNRGMPTYSQRIPLRLTDGSLCYLQEEAHFTQISANQWVLMGICFDCTPLSLSEQALHRQTFRDPLTGLTNRFALLHEMERLKTLPDTAATLISLDLDRFKIINDSLGHGEGDTILKAISQRLKWLFESEFQADQGQLYRLGGDEFAFLLTQTLTPSSAASLAERLISCVATPLNIQEHPLMLTASIGVAMGQSHNASELLRHADTALYQAKGQGRSGWRFFEPQMESKAYQRFELEIELRRALENHEIVPFYQPIVDLTTNHTTYLEALARWKHPTKGMIPPSDFIPIAEETGLILALGSQILRQACFQTKRWRRQYPGLGISVNVSGIQLRSPWFVETVLSILDESDLEPSALTLEITESVLMADSAHHLLVLQALAETGIQLAIDDFGTGYSSMAYLSQLPVHVLKIDRMFVNRLMEVTGPKDNRAVIRAVVALARSQAMRVTAEGIETDNQLSQLKNLGCDHGQGYFLAKPLSQQDTTTFLENLAPAFLRAA